ncbi:TTC39/IML2 family protein [Granulicella sp. dw_53]|uniref:TTC39/IML2 family protein n=1 Tax=Granulicella sp. dw_53 TaxID=2719792 RepID=UPI00210596AC|nr:TTC39/IML2 family protein [Granulicella sp. dw_53]
MSSRNFYFEKFASLRSFPLLAFVVASLLAIASVGAPQPLQAQSRPQSAPNSLHTAPLNLDPTVHEGYQQFYILDYEGALSRFESVLAAHPQDPMASNYVLMVTVFRELYHQDLLDTTYYAHDSFLTSKRSVLVPQATRDRIESLTNTVSTLCDQRIKANPADKDAWFARGYARGMHAAFITLVDHSYVSAARQGLAARNDSEQTLKIDPDYADAKMAIGIQQFAVASLPRLLRIMVGIAGVSGNREKGLQLLREAAAHGTITAVESRTTLSLFLRHDARYAEALVVQHGLASEYPRDYLFRLEEANLTKDSGNGPAAIAIYKAVLADARKPGYFIDPRLQMAWFGLADTERGQNQIRDAAQHYLVAADQPKCSDWLRRRAQLNAGQMYDLLHDRPLAIRNYQLAAAGGGDQSQADAARKYLKSPYTDK